jgi:hypothetical protein
VEAGCSARRGQHPHVVGQQAVERPLQRLRLELARQLEGRDLPERVDAGIGASRRSDCDPRASGQPPERLFQGALNRAAARPWSWKPAKPVPSYASVTR